jgi:dihydroorotase
MMPLSQKNITAEVCVHHLHFTSNDYGRLGNLIKCNPAIKAAYNREALWQALLDDRLDVIATDHAPHTLQEKGVTRNAAGLLVVPPPGTPEGELEKGHAGLPLVQHSLLLMLHYVKEGRITLEKVVEKMSHAVATCYQVADRGFIREGYWADLVMVNMNIPATVTKENILFKCGWSPLEHFTFPATITNTFVNGNMVYGNGQWNESHKGARLLFNR